MMKTTAAESHPSLPAADAHNPTPTLSSITLNSKEPIRAELYGLESLKARARDLAAAFRGRPQYRTEGPLLPRLRQNHHVLVRYHRRCAEEAARGEPLAPDAEWLLDNFYIVDGVLRAVGRDLPRGYYKELPKLAAGKLAGYPCIYALRAVADRSHRQRSRREPHHLLRPGVPGGRAPDHRRVVGRAHHAAIGAAGKPASSGRTGFGCGGGAPARRGMGVAARRSGQGGAAAAPPRSSSSPPGGERGGDADRSVRPSLPPSGARRRVGGGDREGEGLSGRSGGGRRRGGATGKPAPGRQPGFGRQLHHESAPPGGARLGQVLRGRQRRRGRLARGPGGSLCEPGLRHARPLPSGRGAAVPALATSARWKRPARPSVSPASRKTNRGITSVTTSSAPACPRCGPLCTTGRAGAIDRSTPCSAIRGPTILGRSPR